MSSRSELGFAVLAVAVVVACLGVAVVAAEGGDSDVVAAPNYDADLPDDPESEGIAVVNGEHFDSAQAAVDAAEPGDTVVLSGAFEERVVVTTPDVRIVSADAADEDELAAATDEPLDTDAPALLDGGGEGDVLTVESDDVTIEGLWIRNSGERTTDEDAAVFLNGSDATIREGYVTESTFGIWVNGVDDATITDTVIVGREDVAIAQRGNGIHLWEADGAHIEGNEITTVRDGIYYSWSENVHAEANVMWDLRYGVHYMYSDDNTLTGNLAFDNDVGYALMVSENLQVEENIAIDNAGESGHGILVKDIERSSIERNAVLGNDNGFYVYNAQDNEIADNLIQDNGVGLYSTAGSTGQTIHGNSMIDNVEQVRTTASGQIAWNATDRGNYWSDASLVDVTGDGVSDVYHRPAGTVEHVQDEHPQTRAFASSPAFDAVRVAESAFPVVESPGIVDHHPLVDPTREKGDYLDDDGRIDDAAFDDIAVETTDDRPGADADDAGAGDHEDHGDGHDDHGDHDDHDGDSHDDHDEDAHDDHDEDAHDDHDEDAHDDHDEDDHDDHKHSVAEDAIDHGGEPL